MRVHPVAGVDHEPRVLALVVLREPLPTGVRVGESLEDLLRGAVAAEHGVQVEIDRHPREPLELVIGPVEGGASQTRDHVGDGLLVDLGKRLLAELEERVVRAKPDEDHLHVEMPGQVLGLHQAVEELVHLETRTVRLVVRHHRHVLELGQIRHLERLELGDLDVGPLLPVLLDLGPVLVVVTGPLPERHGPGRDPLPIQDRTPAQVSVAVDDAEVHAGGRRQLEDPVVAVGDRDVAELRRHHVERLHGIHQVVAVLEPELAAFVLRAVLAEQHVVRVHLLPTFTSLGGGDGKRIRKRAGLLVSHHRSLSTDVVIDEDSIPGSAPPGDLSFCQAEAAAREPGDSAYTPALRSSIGLDGGRRGYA